MRISFTQSGGVLGTVKGCEVDTTTLDALVAHELHQLVKQSDFTTPSKSNSVSSRDFYEYEIIISDGVDQLSTVLTDATLPQTVKPLVAFLKKISRPKALN